VNPDLRAALPGTRRVLAVVGVVLALALLVPLVVILPLAFSGSEFLTFPPKRWSTEWFTTVLTDPDWRAAFTRSLWLAALDMLVAVVAGTCAALAVRRTRRSARLARTVLLAPLVLPQLVLALGLYLAVQDVGGTTGTLTLLVGQSLLATPLVFLGVTAGLDTVDPALSRAAASLGHPWWSVVARVELPLVARSIVGAALLAYGLCFDESVLGYLLSPPGSETLPSLIWQSASQSATPAIAAASTLVIGIALVLMGLTAVVTGARRKQ
jgi:putative spermidine/putrescine transport system permease protein